MATKVYTSALTGFSATSVLVEADMTRNLPGIVIVGLGNKSVDESRERIKSALINSKLLFPRQRVTINLAPADLPKESASFDLAMTCAILSLTKQIDTPSLNKLAIYGELGLDGTIRPVRGIIAHLLSLQSQNITKALIPAQNLSQAKLVQGVELIPCRTLREVYLYLRGEHAISAPEQAAQHPTPTYSTDFKDIIGQSIAKRALEITAAGQHNILLTGPPGAGKTLLAKALQSILPPPTQAEILEMTQIASLVEVDRDGIITTRPFRSPHNNASQVALIGGGKFVTPGEISRAHGGVLFLDELPEFSRAALESLRQPLEDYTVTVSRAHATTTFPARFTLVATKNPCPCGYSQSPDQECICSPLQVSQYSKRLSGPLLDRIDLTIQVESINHETLLTTQVAESSAAIQKRVIQAVNIQIARQKKLNSHLSSAELKQCASLNQDARDLLIKSAQQLNLTSRSYLKVIKVARTIADLAHEKHITTQHVSEALQYRLPPSSS